MSWWFPYAMFALFVAFGLWGIVAGRYWANKLREEKYVVRYEMAPDATVREIVDALQNDSGVLHIMDTSTGTVFRAELEGVFDLTSGDWITGGLR